MVIFEANNLVPVDNVTVRWYNMDALIHSCFLWNIIIYFLTLQSEENFLNDMEMQPSNKRPATDKVYTFICCLDPTLFSNNFSGLYYSF
jgi:hypothetical protein